MDLDTNPFIQELDQIALLYTADDKYNAVRNLTTDQKALFEIYDVDQDDFEYYARDFNKRNNTSSHNPERKLPDKEMPVIVYNSHKKGRRSISETVADVSADDEKKEQPTKSKGGRPKGKKDSVPRKPRSDKGKKRGPRTNK